MKCGRYMVKARKIISSWNQLGIWGVLLLSIVNLLYMHYYILFSYSMEFEIIAIDVIDNLIGVLFDVILLYAFSYIVTKGNIKLALSILFIITLIWSFSNVMYSRFFQHYLTFSSIVQVDSLQNAWMIKCVFDQFKYLDLFYLVFILLYFKLIRLVRYRGQRVLSIKALLLAVVSFVFLDLILFAITCAADPSTRYLSYYLHRTYLRFWTWSPISPNKSHFCRGSVRTLYNEIKTDFGGRLVLSDNQKALIKDKILESKKSIKIDSIYLSPDNIIFILVESYMSFTSDMKVNGKEVTPNLNALKHSAKCYYNGKVKENVTIGESSDGQLIYMTGLLPLRSLVTVSKVRKHPLPALPKQLGVKSRMIIPTDKTLWEQESMCKSYGFDNLYSKNDYSESSTDYLNDKAVFDFAAKVDSTSRYPFFSVILTISMHQPYNKQIDSSFIISDSNIDTELACYLNASHYTDNQIGLYLEKLKQLNLYDNSMIIIVSDHAVHNTDFNGVSKDLPLYIYYSKGLPEMWKGECNQVDIYPTILNLLGKDVSWYGLGKSLLSDKYSNTIDNSKWDISEWILLSDYFN